MTMQYLLMGAQAAGIFTDMWSQRSAYKMARRGQELDEAQVGLRMNQERLQFEQESLGALENLREVMATQRAMFAAQGRNPGLGSARGISESSQRAFTREEQAKSLSLGFREHYLKSQVALSRIGLAAKKAQQGADMFGKAFSMFNPSGFSGFLGNGSNKYESPLKGLGNG